MMEGRNPRKCQPCLESGHDVAPSHVCIECTEYMCSACSELHKRFKISKHHTIREEEGTRNKRNVVEATEDQPSTSKRSIPRQTDNTKLTEILCIEEHTTKAYSERRKIGDSHRHNSVPSKGLICSKGTKTALVLHDPSDKVPVARLCNYLDRNGFVCIPEDGSGQSYTPSVTISLQTIKDTAEIMDKLIFVVTHESTIERKSILKMLLQEPKMCLKTMVILNGSNIFAEWVALNVYMCPLFICDLSYIKDKQLDELTDKLQGETALHNAAFSDNAIVAVALISAGADVNYSGLGGRTPLHAAVVAHAISLIEVLLSNSNVNLNARNVNGSTALMLAVALHNSNVVLELLLQTLKVDVHATDNTGRSALHWAVEKNRSEAVRRLIKSGADPDAMTNKNETPLFLAARLGYGQCFSALLLVGANMELSDNMGRKPIDIALEHLRHQVIDNPTS